MTISGPIILTNFKTYESATGAKALELAKIHEKVAQETGKTFAIAVQATDIARITEHVSIPVFAQHIDPAEYGSYTGHILPESVVEAGAVGTLLNHSEHRLEWDILKKSVEKAKELNLITAVCAQDADEAKKISEELDPSYVCVEPPELIGGDISVSTAQPELISSSVANVKEGTLLVGAGVKNSKDVRISIELGAMGVLLASGVTKAENPEEVLRDLAKGLS